MTLPLNYQRFGDINKPPLLLCHGLFGSLENLFSIKRGLEHHFDIIAVDLPDHGRSPFSQQFSFQLYAQSIIDLLNQLKIEKAHLLGHSLGGKIVMQIALTIPQKVNKLVIADIAPVSYSPRHQSVMSGLRAVDLATLSNRSDADKYMREYIEEAGVRQFLLKSLYQKGQKWAWRFNLPLLERDYALLIKAPDVAHDSQFYGDTLFIKGGRSDYLLADHQQVIKQHFPNSQAKIISDAGHWLHAEKPSVFNRLVEQFLLAVL